MESYLLGINFDNKLNFGKHLEGICQKTSSKVNVLWRLVPYTGATKWHTLMNVFFKSQFNYCPLICMCCNWSLINKIDRLHETYFRIIHSDKKLSFNELLEKDCCVTIHHRNIRQFSIEMFKVFSGLSSEIFKWIFQFRDEIF